MTDDPYTIEYMPGEALIIITCTPDYSARLHLDALLEEAITRLDGLDAPTPFIIDLTDATHSLDEMFLSMRKVSEATATMLRHPHYGGTIYVTPRPAEQRMAKLMNRELMGRQPARVAPTRDEAITMALDEEGHPPL